MVTADDGELHVARLFEKLNVANMRWQGCTDNILSARVVVHVQQLLLSVCMYARSVHSFINCINVQCHECSFDATIGCSINCEVIAYTICTALLKHCFNAFYFTMIGKR